MDTVEIDLMYSIFGLTDCKNIITNSGTESMEYLLVISRIHALGSGTDVMFETRCITGKYLRDLPRSICETNPLRGWRLEGSLRDISSFHLGSLKIVEPCGQPSPAPQWLQRLIRRNATTFTVRVSYRLDQLTLRLLATFPEILRHCMRWHAAPLTSFEFHLIFMADSPTPGPV